ncbi:MAG: hypothetical protein KA885_11695 [Spirochaetes bacterium]|nr:hypothetical protein [Spirochaetota bacterium]
MKFVFTIIFYLLISVFIYSESICKVLPINKKQSSGVYVRQGDEVTISVSGKWSLWDKYSLADGEGHDYKANDLGNWGALLGKIGAGDVFYIGNGTTFASQNDGILYLFPNKDKYLIENQSGELDVIITGGTPLDDFKNELAATTRKLVFNPKDGLLSTNILVNSGDFIQIYAIGYWNMWDGVYPEVSAEGHDFLANGEPWGKLYGSIGSSYGESLEYFPIGEKTSYTAVNSGILSLYPFISNYVAVKNGELEIYISGGTEAQEDQIASIDKEVQKYSEQIILNKLNAFRSACKLNTFTIDDRLSDSAVGHAKYMIKNNVFTREQDINNPFFTGVTLEERLKMVGYEGRVREMFCMSDLTADAVELFINSIYHRTRLMDPLMSTFGYGCYKSGDSTIHAFDYGYSEATDDVSSDWTYVAYPEDGAINVNYSWNGIENPDPFPNGTVKPLGAPVTILFKEQISKAEKALITDADNVLVDCFIISPETDINEKKINAISLVPKIPLKANATYLVNVEVKLGSIEEIQSYSWSFTTKE